MVGNMRLSILFACIFIITSCALVEDARDSREPNILILSDNYRLFQSSDDVNFIKGKMDDDPVKVEPFIVELGWNKEFIAFKRVTLEKIYHEGILNVETGKVMLFDKSMSLQEYLEASGIDDIEMYTVQQLLDEKKERLEY